MQERQSEDIARSEEEQFKQFKRVKRLEEARGNILKIECDCLSPVTDGISLRDTCRQAYRFGLGAIVVFPSYVKTCVTYLGKEPDVALVAALSYPYGEDTTQIKIAAVKRAIKDGVDENEVCAPLSFIQSGNYAYFKRECKKLRRASKGRALRIVFDCSILKKHEIIKACTVAADAGVNCVRLNGADGETVKEVKAALKGKCLIKADGVDNMASFVNMCVMGADSVKCKSALELASYILKQAEM